jgi:hypothetical protein
MGNFNVSGDVGRVKPDEALTSVPPVPFGRVLRSDGGPVAASRVARRVVAGAAER